MISPSLLYNSFNDEKGAGKINPQNIVVLTDVTCGSSGDIFAYVCKMSPKVRVIGRPPIVKGKRTLKTSKLERYSKIKDRVIKKKKLVALLV